MLMVICSNIIATAAHSNATLSDQEIKQEIHDSIGSGWFSKGYENVLFDVQNGFVTLRGTVDSHESSRKVEDSVKKIEGVRQVNNQIAISKQGLTAYSDSQLNDYEKKFPQDAAFDKQDRQINAKIRDKVISKWFSNGNKKLALKTANGVVIITGTVDSSEDVQKVSDLIKEIEGVKSVNNQLTPKNQ